MGHYQDFSADVEEEPFFNPVEYTGTPLPSLRFRPRSAEEAIIALQVYMDVLTLLDLDNDENFDGEYFNIEAVRRKIRDFRDNVEDSRGAFLDLKEAGEEREEELRLAKMEANDARKEVKRVKDDLTDAHRRLDHLNNQIRLQTSIDMVNTIRSLEYRPDEDEDD